MEFIEANRQAIAWILLWIWIALTIFIVAFQRSKPALVYLLNILCLAGWVYLFFGKYIAK